MCGSGCRVVSSGDSPPGAAQTPEPRAKAEPDIKAGGEPRDDDDDDDDDATDASPSAPWRPELTTEVPVDQRCAVDVVAVLADDTYRGSPTSPHQQNLAENRSADEQAQWDAESHFDSYRQCEYQVTMSGRDWRYISTWSTTLDELPDSWCEDARAHIAAEVQRVTKGCTDPHAGAYWGSDLVPL